MPEFDDAVLQCFLDNQKKLFPDEVADRLHQVCLSQSHAAVDEKRIVSLRRVLRHCQRRCVGKAVGIPDHKPVKCVLGVQSRLVFPARVRCCRPRFQLPSQQQLRPQGSVGSPRQAAVDHLLILFHDKVAHRFQLDHQQQAVLAEFVRVLGAGSRELPS